MQVFARFFTERTITLNFVNGVTTIQELILLINDRESIEYKFISMDGVLLDSNLVMTREKFGDKTVNPLTI